MIAWRKWAMCDIRRPLNWIFNFIYFNTLQVFLQAIGTFIHFDVSQTLFIFFVFKKAPFKKCIIMGQETILGDTWHWHWHYKNVMLTRTLNGVRLLFWATQLLRMVCLPQLTMYSRSVKLRNSALLMLHSFISLSTLLQCG